jgi:hypothetical protein
MTARRSNRQVLEGTPVRGIHGTLPPSDFETGVAAGASDRFEVLALVDEPNVVGRFGFNVMCLGIELAEKVEGPSLPKAWRHMAGFVRHQPEVAV